MILSDRAIAMALMEDKIALKPFRPQCLGSNSYDVHLGERLVVYVHKNWWMRFLGFILPALFPVILDSKRDNPSRVLVIDREKGIRLRRGCLYLGITEEYTECNRHLLPTLDGKSSGGRLGMRIHATAGKGDAGFCGYWTLEIDVILSLRVYAGMPVGQLTWEPIEGWVERPYNNKKSAKYQNKSSEPMPSMMFKNWNEERNSWISTEEVPEWLKGASSSPS